MRPGNNQSIKRIPRKRWSKIEETSSKTKIKKMLTLFFHYRGSVHYASSFRPGKLLASSTICIWGSLWRRRKANKKIKLVLLFDTVRQLRKSSDIVKQNHIKLMRTLRIGWANQRNFLYTHMIERYIKRKHTTKHVNRLNFQCDVSRSS